MSRHEKRACLRKKNNSCDSLIHFPQSYKLRLLKIFPRQLISCRKLKSIHSGIKQTYKDTWNVQRQMSRFENGIYFLLKWTQRNAKITKWFHDRKKKFINHSKGSVFGVSHIMSKVQQRILLFLLIPVRVLHTEQVMGWSLSKLH